MDFLAKNFRQIDWLDWLVLRDVLNTACNIMSAAYKGVGGKGGRRVRRVEEWVSELTLPVDTANQVVCTVGQTDGHSSPDHTMSQADVQWNRIRPQATLLMPLNGLTGSVLVLHDLTGSTKGCL